MLFLQSLQVTDEKTREALRESQSRARSIALIHEKLYQAKNMAEIDFGEYVQQLVADLFEAYRVSSQEIALTVHAEAVHLDLDTALPCGLIITELVSNVLKYAFKDRRTGELSIGLASAGGDLVELTVRDNGVGLPADFKIEDAKTWGVRLVSDLARQLNGTLEFQSKNGTLVSLTFPMPKLTPK